MSDDDLQKAGRIASEWLQKLEVVFDGFEAIALPSAQCRPFLAAWNYPKEISGCKMDTYHRWMEVTVPVSVAGLPCVTVPAGFGGDDGILPMGIQLAGRRGNDCKILELAQIYHSATGWPSTRPPPTLEAIDKKNLYTAPLKFGSLHQASCFSTFSGRRAG